MTYPPTQIRHLARFQYGESLSDERRLDGSVAVYGSNGQVGVHNRPNTSGPVIVVGRKGSFGKLQFSREPVFAIDTTYFVDQHAARCDLRWLFFALSTVGLDKLSFDVGVPGLSREAAHAERLPTPPLDKQRAIADFLDAETARIDALIAMRRSMLELIYRRSGAQVRELLAGPVQAADPLSVRTGADPTCLFRLLS